MKKIVIANCNEILNSAQTELQEKYKAIGIQNKEDLNLEDLNLIKPDYIFFMHWSWIIPKSIYNRFNCVVFHMTDLPFGRGGSPLQNLIIRGYKETKISALKVDGGIDTGDIYLKKELSLEGTAAEIFTRTGKIIKNMIEEIINNPITPTKQIGEVTSFKRRKPEQSLIDNSINSIEGIYNFIRMLDADNYPHAFLETDVFKFEFTEAKINNSKELTAHVRIIKK